MSTNNGLNISIEIADIDCVVNAANEGLRMGSGVCGAIFKGAGPDKLTEACRKLHGCPTGSAVITPGFNLKAKYIIHAVGPVWSGSKEDQELLAGCYRESLERAKENDCHSIAFPLISAGIFGCPVDQAWEHALRGCREWIEQNPDYDIKIIFAVRRQEIKDKGEAILSSL
ncbi:MAG: macro domain-containing protein [Eubacterium sp.]|nr:macro domain-containing protein [Eubacterium sp.]